MNSLTPTISWDSHGSSFYTSQNQAIPQTERLYSAPVPYPSGPGGGGGGGLMPTVTPPVPPRPQTRPVYSVHPTSQSIPPLYSYANYSLPYQSPYSNFNSYRYGNFNSRNRSGYFPSALNSEEPTIADLAQESTAPAFQSIESFVSAFTSVSTMLESTFHAVQSSFRAIVEVADHLGRVKQVLHTLAIFRLVRWMFRRVLYLIGISKIKPEQIESAWNSVLAEGSKGSEWAERLSKPDDKKSTWPIIAFLGFILAGPYLVWKLIASLHKNKANWATGDGDYFIAVAEYDFEPATKNELRLKKGNRIRLGPAIHQPQGIKGWVLAADAGRIGLVPVNYIKVLGKEEG